MSTAIAAVEGLTVAYGKLVVLDGLSLTLGPGEVVTIVGANGTGKSTLLRALCSLQPAGFDTAHVDGATLGTPRARANASYAGDEPVFFPDCSVREQLTYLTALGTEPPGHADALIDVLGLVDRRDQLPGTMSRGWRQRTSLACAMARGAPLLCVDEPFVGLDTAGRSQLIAAIDRYRSAGRAIAVATHDLAGLDQLSPRTIVLAD